MMQVRLALFFCVSVLVLMNLGYEDGGGDFGGGDFGGDF